MSLHQPNLPEAGTAVKQVRAKVRRDLPNWLSEALDAERWHEQSASSQATAEYFDHFADRVHDRMRRKVVSYAHKQLPQGLALKLSMPVPAEIPEGATAYFRSLLERIKAQIETQEKEKYPSWFHNAIRLMELPVAPQQAERHTEELLSTLKTAIEEYEVVPLWLQGALKLRSNHIPQGETKYFNSFADRVKSRVAAVEEDEPVQGWLKNALDTMPNPGVPDGQGTYFAGFANKIKRRMVDDEEASVMPTWMDRALQTAKHPHIPGGNAAYFANFAGQVRNTISEMDTLEWMETQDPNTVERLVDSPKTFQSLLDELHTMELPVGQELYFEDFADRVRQRVKERGLVEMPRNPVVLFMTKPPVQWAVAACLGLLIGFIWFWKPDVVPVAPVNKPEVKPAMEQVVQPNKPAAQKTETGLVNPNGAKPTAITPEKSP